VGACLVSLRDNRSRGACLSARSERLCQLSVTVFLTMETSRRSVSGRDSGAPDDVLIIESSSECETERVVPTAPWHWRDSPSSMK
jgi:hypothetical protein